MKKRIMIITIFLLIFFQKEVNAASVSVSASSNYITNGNNVTFYININNAASWVLEGEGSGSTTGCKLGEERVGDSGTGKNANKTLTVTCTSSSVGIIGFTVSGSVWDENYNETPVSVTKSVTVQAPREKDSNNYLKSIKIPGYELTPEFNKDTLEYNINVPSTVDKISIEAEKESGYASLSGTGEFEVNEGVNTFEINVTSETGIERIYKISVNVADENPIEIKIGDSTYTIIKNAKNLVTPETYEKTTVKIKEFDIPAFYSEKSKLTIIGAKDQKGTVILVIYDKEKETYSLYNENKSNQFLLYIKNIPEEKEGFKKDSIVINGKTQECLISELDENTILIYAMNIQTGEDNFYLYNKEDGSYMIYNDTLLKKEKEQNKEELEKYKQVILGFGIALVVALLIIIILIFKKPKKSKKKSKKENKKEVEVTKIENNKIEDQQNPKENSQEE